MLDPQNQNLQVFRVVSKIIHGTKVSLQFTDIPNILCLDLSRKILTKPRPRSLGGNRDWSAAPFEHLERRKQLRKDPTPAEIRLWQCLRNRQTGYKFRRQHPIGPYLVDYYCRDAHLVVEIDGDCHFTDEAIDYDNARNKFMSALGLRVIRFKTDEIQKNLESVINEVKNQCIIQTKNADGAIWMAVSELETDDLVFINEKLLHEGQTSALPVERGIRPPTPALPVERGGRIGNSVIL